MRDAQVRPIVLWPNPDLTLVSQPLTYEDSQDPEIQLLVEDMFATLYYHRAIGLSAIQVGDALQIFVMDAVGGPVGKPVSPHTFVNPRLVKAEGALVSLEEGCLSVPGVVEKIDRYPLVIVESSDLQHEGGLIALQLEGLEAQCAQHELEHLNGIVMPDKFGPVHKDQIKRKIKKFMKARR